MMLAPDQDAGRSMITSAALLSGCMTPLAAPLLPLSIWWGKAPEKTHEDGAATRIRKPSLLPSPGVPGEGVKADARSSQDRRFWHTPRADRLCGRRLSCGFTLIELVATVALAAILAATISVSLRGMDRDVRMEDIADQIRTFDGATRQQVRISGQPLLLRFNIDSGDVVRVDAATGRTHGTGLQFPASPGRLGSGDLARISRLRVAQMDADGGEMDIAFSADGQSPTYAVLLTGPNGRRQWVLFAGTTGQTRILNDDRQVQDTFALLGSDGDDAH